MHSLSCITSWLPYITLCFIDSRCFTPLEQSRTALLAAASQPRVFARLLVGNYYYYRKFIPNWNCHYWVSQQTELTQSKTPPTVITDSIIQSKGTWSINKKLRYCFAGIFICYSCAANHLKVLWYPKHLVQVVIAGRKCLG